MQNPWTAPDPRYSSQGYPYAAAISDRATLDDAATLMKERIAQALLEVSAMLRVELKCLECEDVMQALRREFADDGVVGDALVQALGGFKAKVGE